MTRVFGGVSQLPPVPRGGDPNQVLIKATTTKYDVSWAAGGAPSEGSATLTYTGGLLTRIDYASGNYKVFTYTGETLDRVDYVVGAVTTRRAFTYDGSGNLITITQTTF